MELGLKGKRVVVCGGTTGIGAAAALRFLEEGCSLAVCSHNEEKVAAFAADVLEKGYASVYTETVDVTDGKAVEAFAAHANEAMGGIDIWVNCAGGNKWAPVWDLPEETFDWIMDLNLKSAYLGIKAAAKYMIPKKSGVIVNISSLSSKVPVVYRTVYGAAKAGVNLLTKGCAAELAPFGIRVCAVAPGIIDTVLSKKAIHENPDYTMPLIAMRRAGSPAEVGDVIVCLASERFGYVTGTIVEIDGGKDMVEDPDISWTSPW